MPLGPSQDGLRHVRPPPQPGPPLPPLPPSGVQVGQGTLAGAQVRVGALQKGMLKKNVGDRWQSGSLDTCAGPDIGEHAVRAHFQEHPLPRGGVGGGERPLPGPSQRHLGHRDLGGPAADGAHPGGELGLQR